MSPLFVVCVAVIAFLYYLSTKQPKGFPDGPRFTLPIIGNALSLGSKLIDGFDHLRQQYGDIYGLYLGPNRSVIVSNFDLIQEVGAHPAFQYRQTLMAVNGMRGDWVKTGNNEKCVGGIILSNGITWSEQRRFALHTLRDLGFGKSSMEDMIVEEVQELCKELEKKADKPIDVKNSFNLAVLNSLWTIATNKRLDYDDAQMTELVVMTDEFFKELGNPTNMMLFMYPITAKIAEAVNVLVGPKTSKKILELFSRVVSDHEATFEEDNLRDFTDHYLKEMRLKSASDEGSSFKGEDGRTNLVNCLFDFFIAGAETTSTTLNWAMLYLIMHPDVQSKVQEELDEVTGRGRLPTLDDRESTPYTEAVIHELQRCVNLVPFSVVHKASEDAILGGKYFIPKATEIYSYLDPVMNDPKEFPNPHVFDPTRHIKDGKFQAHPMIVPFGVGRRRCMGEPLARMSLYLFLTGILSNFNLAKVSEDDKPSLERVFGATMSPHPYELRFIPRK